jgi:hypothetical protein
MAEPRRALQTEVVEQVLPLVLEIIPGQAGEGLIDVYEPGSYEGESLRKLCEKTLSKRNWSIEEQQIVEDINRQLDGGKLLCRGRQIEDTALEYTVVEETEAGEKYLYVPIRAIKPQEGGLHLPHITYQEGPQEKATNIERAERKKWDPNCPECKEELQRVLELSEGIYDEVDHGGGLYRVRPPDYCDHESKREA